MNDSFLNSGIGFIAQVQEERVGQIRREGFTAEHDDEHRNGELAQAAACYAMPPKTRSTWRDFIINFWPWLVHWWKPAAIPDRPQARQRELIKAAALLYAEWDRLERHILRINAAPTDTLADSAVTEPGDITPDHPLYLNKVEDFTIPKGPIETTFEKAIRETAEKNITDELAKHPVIISWDYNQHPPEIITARAWYDEYNRLHLAFDKPLPKPDDPERFT